MEAQTSVRLLALDQASHTTGWSYFKDGQLIKHGSFTASDKEIGDRLYSIKNYILHLIDLFEINQIIFEDIQLQEDVSNNVQTFKVLAEVLGIVYELSTELNIKHLAVSSNIWKSKLGIKGMNRDQDKANSRKFVLDTYELAVTEDEADAICIGTYFFRKNTITEKKIPKTKTKSKTKGFDWSK